MNELAEPLIPKDLNEINVNKKTLSDCAPTDLHFIRCLKPNDNLQSEYFVDAMIQR